MGRVGGDEPIVFLRGVFVDEKVEKKIFLILEG